MPKYWKVTGSAFNELLVDWTSRFKEAEKSVLRFSRRNGGSRKYYGRSIGFAKFGAVIKFSKLPDEKLWKRDSKGCDDLWVPRKSTRAAKALSQELEAINKQFPDMHELLEFLGIDLLLPNMTIARVGVRQLGDDFYISTHNDFKGHPDIERCSDIEYEQVAA